MYIFINNAIFTLQLIIYFPEISSYKLFSELCIRFVRITWLFDFLSNLR